jgi:hypothetical protein
MDNYVVYCYLDPKKPGIFLFGNLKFDYEPIYIGKGKPNRPQRHLTLYKNNTNRFYSKLQSIIESGITPEYKIIKSNLTEEKSFEYEKHFIELIGRIENNGTLTNLTDGGEGQSGFKFSNESKLKRSQNFKGVLNPMFGKSHSEETISKISKSKIGEPSNRKDMTFEEIYGNDKSTDIKQKMSEKGKERIGEKNPMFGKKHKEESIEKMRTNRIQLFGEKNPNYGRKYKESEKTFDTWEITDINGNTLIIDNLTKYCRENQLNPTCMRDVFYGRMKKHKQWVKVNKITNNVKQKKSRTIARD